MLLCLSVQTKDPGEGVSIRCRVVGREEGVREQCPKAFNEHETVMTAWMSGRNTCPLQMGKASKDALYNRKSQ